MPRPTILVAEREPLQALSTRKLVLETAKFNVLTAHSTKEALDLFHLFPNISMAVLSMHEDIDCHQIAKSIKEVTSKIPIIALSPRNGESCDFADHLLSSYEPELLVQLIRSKLGDPRRFETPEQAR
jgi:DNA-binding response OmpR family regulator